MSRDGKTGQYVSNKIHNKMEKSVQQVNFKPNGRDEWEEGIAVTPETVAEQYPSKGYSAADKRDEKYELIEQLQKESVDAGGRPGATPYGQVQWNDDVVEWMKKKKQAGIKLQFEKWFSENFDKMTPTAKALAQQLYPNFYKERLQTLKLNIKMLEQLASIRLRGVQTKSDLFLQFAADQGLIDMDNIQNILHPEGDADRSADQFKRGLFNPRRHMMGDQDNALHGANRELFHGLGVTPMYGPAPAGQWPNMPGLARNGNTSANVFNNWSKQ